MPWYLWSPNKAGVPMAMLRAAVHPSCYALAEQASAKQHVISHAVELALQCPPARNSS